MKAELERIWLDSKCRMPLNLIWWRLGDTAGFGYKETNKIWYSKGKRNRIKNVSARKTSYKFKRTIGSRAR